MNVVKPETLGFADNGDLWRSWQGPKGLIEHLERKSTLVRNWFAQAEWATEDTLGLRPLPRKKMLHPIQDYVNLERVEAYKKDSSTPADLEPWELHPTLFRWWGEIFIFQGTHRLEALYQAKATHYYGWFIDLDRY